MAMAEADQPPLTSDECRAPTLADLVKLCQALNEAAAKYIIIGGFAIRAAGFLRNTSILTCWSRLGLTMNNG